MQMQCRCRPLYLGRLSSTNHTQPLQAGGQRRRRALGAAKVSRDQTLGLHATIDYFLLRVFGRRWREPGTYPGSMWPSPSARSRLPPAPMLSSFPSWGASLASDRTGARALCALLHGSHDCNCKMFRYRWRSVRSLLLVASPPTLAFLPCEASGGIQANWSFASFGHESWLMYTLQIFQIYHFTIKNQHVLKRPSSQSTKPGCIFCTAICLSLGVGAQRRQV